MFNPGDWVDVGRHMATQWIDCGDAVLPKHRKADLRPGDAGIVVKDLKARSKLGHYAGIIDAVQDRPSMPWPKTMIWDGRVNVKPGLILTGFHLLDKWQMLVPIKDYKTLALHAGTEQDRNLTRAVLPDMRIPVYESGLVFARRCAETIKLIEQWNSEPGDRDLAFLRALYQNPLYVLALPTTWL